MFSEDTWMTVKGTNMKKNIKNIEKWLGTDYMNHKEAFDFAADMVLRIKQEKLLARRYIFALNIDKCPR